MAKLMNKEITFPLTSEINVRNNEVESNDATKTIILDIPQAYDRAVPSEQRRCVVTNLNSRYDSLAKAKGGDIITVEKVSAGGTIKTWSPEESKWVSNIHVGPEPRYLFKGIITKIGQETWFADQFSGTLDSLFANLGQVVSVVETVEELATEIAEDKPKATRKPRSKSPAKQTV